MNFLTLTLLSFIALQSAQAQPFRKDSAGIVIGATEDCVQAKLIARVNAVCDESLGEHKMIGTPSVDEKCDIQTVTQQDNPQAVKTTAYVTWHCEID